MKRVVANRRIFPFLILVTARVGLLAGCVATLVDEKDFPTFGDGAWWAIVTLATVGYGDIVPTTTVGRVVGSTLIILGVTFLSFLTAIVTSLFVSVDQERSRARQRNGRRRLRATPRPGRFFGSSTSVSPRSRPSWTASARRARVVLPNDYAARRED